MNAQTQSTTYYWWALGIVGTFALTLVVLLLVGVLGPGVWWTAAAMSLLAISNALSIRTITRRNRRRDASTAPIDPPRAD
jgi:hypothetical protein